ncbi:GAF and ANTAR domain-containing protein [Mycobacterium yunnanensis]|uniref:GAF and ANTAR domain-containing protein n=1 Tax=Mycobacterium yunnanensis TaxID=368477 RepID=A0A9X3C3Y7_9MYCO|nr:GAF and ANTAR domain-containing protein [Mycobacterium yunnanensis]MCV7423801.1 GAF and ANTAR domain-containing protein [Mycobacterium yunnanensis]
MTENTRPEAAQLLGELAVEMHAQDDTDDILQTITAGAVSIVPGVRWAGISLVKGRAVEARAPTHPLVGNLDAWQSETGQGPCISALHEHHTVHINDMGTDARWPVFARAALELGVRTSLSCRLFVGKDTMGALNLYGGEPGVFDDESFFYGELFAQHASVALAGAQAADQFHRALASRDLIGQAKGMIMERFKIGEVQAFTLLTRLSQETNTKLADVALSILRNR